ncbi:DUF4937 domain-containing protein [Streptomyces sp. NPDC059104]|uniref:DUF4937 domain-containing protein n=1 Tax=Streptomyces sp. NPDC059104 TaxID=3346729 RepID=UPI0036B1DEB8
MQGGKTMWGKWIGCSVPAAGRERFSEGQRGWAVIAGQRGLVGQVGGWDPATGRAHVLGLWSDAGAYRRFMEERHDRVFAGTGGRGGYSAIETAAGETLFDMPGDAAGLPAALGSATLLRVADCRLLPGRAEHFLEVQRDVWAPAMAAAGGMLGGTVTSLGDHRRLVTTLWSGPEPHERYVAGHLPALRARAGLREDLHAVTGHLIPLEPDWRVLPVPAVTAG